MKKKWFVFFGDVKKGPYDILGLKCLPDFTPDTLVWCEGMPKPLPARWIPELKNAFKDPEPLDSLPNENDNFPCPIEQLPPSAELAIDMGGLKPPVLYWLIAITVLLIILLLQRFS